ncbi:FGFR1 oncogene partner 2 homolog isoform X5 [Cherax quadricarinatus]|uniref:FGFR1 oncogene partner 2 homolog isoform X5 n=1 Tax=Cherax quadricarinatus TaxID=27406 RepID=UPI0023797DB5|nr:FGFR1 oncogene partner 2 homolog isoform X2 [Cherax quadricarinatus]
MREQGSSSHHFDGAQFTSTTSSPATTPPVTTTPQNQSFSRNKRKHTVVFKYCEEMNELNEAANNRPRSALIHSIQQENRHIRQLQQENKELRLALEEHQNVMELIMSKYRQQVAKLVTVNSKQTQPNTQEQAKLAAQIERISEMVAVMRKAASLGDDESQQQQRLITALATENKGLREMLNIASRSGSILPAACSVDAGTQTEQDSTKVEEQSQPIEQDGVNPKNLPKEENKSLESHETTVS